MSFAKAKIQRFNELENDVPPPGAYDPIFNSAIKGATLDKSDRFNENKSTSMAECNLSVCNRSVNQSSITFRTPQPAQKTDILKRNITKVKSKVLQPSTGTKLKYTTQNELVDLQVECSNKTKTIEEHMKHIQDVQEERQKLQFQLEELEKKQAETEERHQKEIASMIQLQQEVLNQHIEKHLSEVELIRKQLLETCNAKTHEIQIRKDLESDLRSFKEKVNTLEFELINQRHISRDKILDLESAIAELTRINTEKTAQLDANCKMKDARNTKIEKQLQVMEERLHELQNMFLKLEEKSSNQEIEISRLETMNSQLDLQLEESKVAINSLTEVNEFLEAETAKHKNTLSKANARIEELSNTLSERDNNVDDKTNSLLKAAQEEIKKLLEYNARLKKDHDEISEQYAALIGHQNHKQRIKHVSQLKDKINQLEKDLRVKTTKIEQQQKIIEKIKSEEKRVPHKFG